MNTFQQPLEITTGTKYSDLEAAEVIMEKAPMQAVAPLSIAPISEADSTAITNALKDFVDTMANQLAQTDKSSWEHVSEVRFELEFSLVPKKIAICAFPSK